MDAPDLMKGSIDIHIHIGPDPLRRRRVTAYEAAIQAREAGMRMYIQTMLHCGITEDEIVRMVRINPARVLGLPE